MCVCFFCLCVLMRTIRIFIEKRGAQASAYMHWLRHLLCDKRFSREYSVVVSGSQQLEQIQLPNAHPQSAPTPSIPSDQKGSVLIPQSVPSAVSSTKTKTKERSLVVNFICLQIHISLRPTICPYLTPYILCVPCCLPQIAERSEVVARQFCCGRAKRIGGEILYCKAQLASQDTTAEVTIGSNQLDKVITFFVLNMAYSWENRVDFVVKYMYGKLFEKNVCVKLVCCLWQIADIGNWSWDFVQVVSMTRKAESDGKLSS